MTTAICKPKFNLGQILATPGALDALQESGQNVAILPVSACAWRLGRSR